MRLPSALFFLFITHISFSQYTIWATQGNPKSDTSTLEIGTILDSTAILNLELEDYVCLYDRDSHKLLECKGIQILTHAELQNLFLEAERLPNFSVPYMNNVNSYNRIGNVSSRRPPLDELFPVQEEIHIGIEDTMVFIIKPSAKSAQPLDFISITDFFNQVLYQHKLDSNDSHKVCIPVYDLEVSVDEFFESQDSTEIFTCLIDNNLEYVFQEIHVKTPSSLVEDRFIINELLNKKTIAYNTCAIIYALEHKLAFDALKIALETSSQGLTYSGFDLMYQKWRFSLEGDLAYRPNY